MNENLTLMQYLKMKLRMHGKTLSSGLLFRSFSVIAFLSFALVVARNNTYAHEAGCASRGF